MLQSELRKTHTEDTEDTKPEMRRVRIVGSEPFLFLPISVSSVFSVLKIRKSYSAACGEGTAGDTTSPKPEREDSISAMSALKTLLDMPSLPSPPEPLTITFGTMSTLPRSIASAKRAITCWVS